MAACIFTGGDFCAGAVYHAEVPGREAEKGNIRESKALPMPAGPFCAKRRKPLAGRVVQKKPIGDDVDRKTPFVLR